MKLCIIGSYTGKLDEGMTNVSYHLYQEMHNYFYDLSYRNVREVVRISFWIQLIRNRPNIIHFVPGPTMKGLVLVKLLKLLLGCKTVVSATKPVLPRYFRSISRIVRPDIVIVQSTRSENLFRGYGYDTIFIPNGVDIEKFKPVDKEKRKILRYKYGFSDTDYIVLHVGPLKIGRNQQSLLTLKGVKVLLIVSLTNPSEDEQMEEFESPNVIVWKKYFPNIEDIFAMVDVYVFPVFEPLNSIEIPLSVLEALACNIPVITTKYGALGRILEEGKGLYYLEETNKIEQILEEVRKGKNEVNTRAKVQNLSWKVVVAKVANVYDKIYKS